MTLSGYFMSNCVFGQEEIKTYKKLNLVHDTKMPDWKIRHQKAGMEYVGLENARKGKYGTLQVS